MKKILTKEACCLNRGVFGIILTLLNSQNLIGKFLITVFQTILMMLVQRNSVLVTHGSYSGISKCLLKG